MNAPITWPSLPRSKSILCCQYFGQETSLPVTAGGRASPKAPTLNLCLYHGKIDRKAPVKDKSLYASAPMSGMRFSAAARARSRSMCGCTTAGATGTSSRKLSSSSSPPSMRLCRRCFSVNCSGGMSRTPSCRPGSLTDSYCTDAAFPTISRAAPSQHEPSLGQVSLLPREATAS